MDTHIEGISESFRLSLYMTSVLSKCLASLAFTGPYIDFGPVHAFWLFFFERYNGEMAANITNNRSVEIQYMRKFITIAHVHPKNGNVPSTYKDEFQELFYRHNSKDRAYCVNQRPVTLYYNSFNKGSHRNFMGRHLTSSFANDLWKMLLIKKINVLYTLLFFSNKNSHRSVVVSTI